MGMNARELNAASRPQGVLFEGVKKVVTKDLGAMLHLAGPMHPEIQARQTAAWRNWYAYGAVFRSHHRDVPMALKAELFKSVCDSVMLAGLEARPMTASMLEQLDRVRLGRMRVALNLSANKRGATGGRPNGPWRAKSHEEILILMKNLTLDSQLRIRRIHLFRTICAHPQEFKQVLAALLGDSPYDPAPLFQDGTPGRHAPSWLHVIHRVLSIAFQSEAESGYPWRGFHSQATSASFSTDWMTRVSYLGKYQFQALRSTTPTWVDTAEAKTARRAARPSLPDDDTLQFPSVMPTLPLPPSTPRPDVSRLPSGSGSRDVVMNMTPSQTLSLGASQEQSSSSSSSSSTPGPLTHQAQREGAAARREFDDVARELFPVPPGTESGALSEFVARPENRRRRLTGLCMPPQPAPTPGSTAAWQILRTMVYGAKNGEYYTEGQLLDFVCGDQHEGVAFEILQKRFVRAIKELYDLEKRNFVSVLKPPPPKRPPRERFLQVFLRLWTTHPPTPPLDALRIPGDAVNGVYRCLFNCGEGFDGIKTRSAHMRAAHEWTDPDRRWVRQNQCPLCSRNFTKITHACAHFQQRACLLEGYRVRGPAWAAGDLHQSYQTIVKKR